jgi:hypothetical protein
MKRLLIGFVLSSVAASAASASSQLDAKLSVTIDKERRVSATIDIANNGKRPVCFRAHENWVLLVGTDGLPLGDIFSLEVHPIDYVSVVWPGLPDTFDLPINGGHPRDRGNFLTQNEIDHLVKATTRLDAYDCIDYFRTRAEPKRRIERDLSAVPTIVP